MKYKIGYVTADRVLESLIYDINLTPKSFLGIFFFVKHKYKDKSTLFSVSFRHKMLQVMR